MDETIEIFTAAFRDSIAAGTFVKLTLSNYKGTDEHLQKITTRSVETKKGSRILFQFKGRTSDLAKNFDAGEAVAVVARHLHSGFRSGHLFTTERDHQIIIGKRSAKLTAGKPAFETAAPVAHDRGKQYLVDIRAPYLKALGVTTERSHVPTDRTKVDKSPEVDGLPGVSIRSDQRDKWKQINKFVEILDNLFESSDLKNKTNLSIVDMGSGKGYLTFAAYDHFSRKGKSQLRVVGVESRPQLVSLCNEIAEVCGYDGLRFVQGDIADHDVDEVDILIALHACDTATDEALYQGIAAKASVIVAAPCCHNQVRKQLRSPDLLAGVLKHPVMLERTAETLTDGIRSLLLEREGYRTKMFEFVPSQHTPKNNMMVAVRGRPVDDRKIAEIDSLMEAFGIDHQCLYDRLVKRT